MGDTFGLVIDGEWPPASWAPTRCTIRCDRRRWCSRRPRRRSAQLDRAVAGGPPCSAGMGGAGLRRACRAGVQGGRRPPGDVVSRSDLASLLTREHGKVLWEAQFDSGTIAGMATAFVPWPATRSPAACCRGTGVVGPRSAAVPHGVVAAILPFNWPVSVLGNKVLPALLDGQHRGREGTAYLPRCRPRHHRARWPKRCHPASSTPSTAPAPSSGAALVAHPGVDMVSFTGGPSTGRAVMAGASAELTPLVLELGGNDPAIVAPDVDIDETLAGTHRRSRLHHQRPGVHGHQAPLRPRGQGRAPWWTRSVARVGAEVVGDGLAPETTMGPVHMASAVTRVEAMLDDARARGATVHRPARVRDEDAGAGGYLVSPAIVVGAPDDASIVSRRAVRPGAARARLSRHRRCVVAGQRHASSGCARRCGPADDALAADVARPARGRNGLRQRARHLGHGPPGPVRRVEAVGLRARAGPRGHGRVHPAQDRSSSSRRCPTGVSRGTTW